MQARQTNPGCFRYGCAIALVLFALVIGGVTLWARKSLRSAVIEYTSETSSPLKVKTVRPESIVSASEKFAKLVSAASGDDSVSLSFSEEELRGLVESSRFKDRLDLSLVEDGCSARFSLPLSMLGDWQAASVIVKDITQRSIVGSVRANISVSEGKLSFTITDLELHGMMLGEMARGHASEWIVGAIEAALADNGSEAAGLKNYSEGTILPRVQNLRVVDNSVVISLLPR